MNPRFFDQPEFLKQSPSLHQPLPPSQDASIAPTTNPATNPARSFPAYWQYLGLVFTNWLMTKPKEPIATLIQHQSGKIEWRVDDPLTNQSFYFDSEETACAWIEKRHVPKKKK